MSVPDGVGPLRVHAVVDEHLPDREIQDPRRVHPALLLQVEAEVDQRLHGERFGAAAAVERVGARHGVVPASATQHVRAAVGHQPFHLESEVMAGLARAVQQVAVEEAPRALALMLAAPAVRVVDRERDDAVEGAHGRREY
ncbi:hypothetical protein D3C87_1487200 [compost metagenome]